MMEFSVRELTRFKKKEIDDLFKRSKRLGSNQGLTILGGKSAFSYGKILVIIPKTVGSAPIRNQIKRRLKTIFYEQRFYQRGLDAIILVRKQGARYSYGTLLTFMQQCFTDFHH